jgi:hypothetical protein
LFAVMIDPTRLAALATLPLRGRDKHVRGAPVPQAASQQADS